MYDLKHNLINKGYVANAVETMLDSRSKNTYQQYQTYWDRWGKFCSEENVEILQTPTVPVINFLQKCREEYSLGFSAVNTARAALSLVSHNREVPLGQESDLSTYMKGVRNQTPHLPKYNSVWDADIMLTDLKSLGDPPDLD